MLTMFPTPSPTDPHLVPAVWIDIESPTAAEVTEVERMTGLRVPVLADLKEIENSRRMYIDQGALYMTLPLALRESVEESSLTHIGLVITADRLLTVRFQRLPTVDAYVAQCRATPPRPADPVALLAGLIDELVEAVADTMEHARDDLDAVSRGIFHSDPRALTHMRANAQMRANLRTVGHTGELVNRVHETLLTLNRIVAFSASHTADWTEAALKPQWKILRADIVSLSEHARTLTQQIEFLQTTVMGMISIEQNNIIKVLAVVSTIGVPPTLVASIYGMNFQNMPELHMQYGYIYGLLLIAISAILPLAWFRYRGWL